MRLLFTASVVTPAYVDWPYNFVDKDAWNITITAVIWRVAIIVSNQGRSKIVAAAILEMIARLKQMGQSGR
jgi:hypothetical protein